MGHPEGTHEHSHVHGGRMQDMGVLVSDRASVTCKCFVAVLGQILSCRVRPMAGSALAALGALVSYGKVRCPFCGGKMRIATSAAAQRTRDPRDVRRGHRGTEGVWSLMAQSQEDRGSPSLSLPTYLQEELYLPGELLPVLCCHQVAALCHSPQSLHPVLQLGSHYPKKLCKAGQMPVPQPGSTVG